MAVPEDIKGEWVVGLNPDDRMPNDWLRMVARVFASYRRKPLKESIVSYIDGLNLSLISKDANEIIIGITPGQSFVDDQFIGFIEDSQLKIPTTAIIYDVRYAIVLHYRWINQMPPQEPSYEIIPEAQVNNEEMLILGYMICTDDGMGGCILTLIDDKTPWYIEMVNAASKNTEVDGEEWLPYIVQIKSGLSAEDGGSEFPDHDPMFPDGNPIHQRGTLDVGWSLDFHHIVGNDVNYNARLHLNTDKTTDGELYIDGKRILSEIDGLNGPVDPGDLDQHGAGDVYMSLNNNTVVFDRFDGALPLQNEGSDSGKACMSLAVERINSTDPLLDNGFGGASWCYDLSTGATSIHNRTDFNDASTAINTLSLTDTVDLVTINGHPIWHGGNLSSTGQTIMFLGYFSSHPTDRPILPGQSTPDPIEDGDIYFNTTNSAYYFLQGGHWVQIAKHIPAKTYEFVATEGQRILAGIEYNPDFIQIYVDGIKLITNEFVATDGINIELAASKPAFKGEEVISIYTIFGAELLSGRLRDLIDVQIINIADGQTIVWDANQSKWVNRLIGGASGDYVNRSGDTMSGSLNIDGSLTTYNNNRISVFDGELSTDARSLLYFNKLQFATDDVADTIMNIGMDLDMSNPGTYFGYNSTLDQWEVNGNKLLDAVDAVVDADELTKGIVRQATNVEADAGTLDEVYMTPADVRRVIDNTPDNFPVGGIIMWSGTVIPSGWGLCDGTNGTPDLVGQFVMGSTAANVGQTGGNADATMPNHAHDSGHKHTSFDSSSKSPAYKDLEWNTTDLVNDGYLTSTVIPPDDLSIDHFIMGIEDQPVVIDIPQESFTTDTQGTINVDENLPPYYTIAYIIKL